MKIIIRNHPNYTSEWTRREFIYHVYTQYGAGYAIQPHEAWASTVFHNLRRDLHAFPEAYYVKMYKGILRSAMP